MSLETSSAELDNTDNGCTWKPRTQTMAFRGICKYRQWLHTKVPNTDNGFSTQYCRNLWKSIVVNAKPLETFVRPLEIRRNLIKTTENHMFYNKTLWKPLKTIGFSAKPCGNHCKPLVLQLSDASEVSTISSTVARLGCTPINMRRPGGRTRHYQGYVIRMPEAAGPANSCEFGP